MTSSYWDIRGNGRNAVVPCIVTPPDQNICGDLPGLFTNVLGGAMWIAEHPAIRQSLIQAEAETRVLTRHQGAWHITNVTDQPQIPSFVWLEQMPNKGIPSHTVQALIQRPWGRNNTEDPDDSRWLASIRRRTLSVIATDGDIERAREVMEET
uniref:Uncharacterized protein n=1 Tax=Chromera velia CCMP2878 TaxID=1169474 RepID=A0A0G4HGF6_9ALVE|eukprot:Cvel_27197.t1-p1 / transcript=Cvel_27197.t1 / gene=Cvel_27197 / organism=Chromera_velia_CCMP2878 / gene_product=hypothetical protein / transcript_product=hypothetical protein / location=Cvel_scaffold3358:9342-9797(-) / protein_length=152 / sequence_SO=supercontig / SO=protein_coding / is_pseudo=false